MSDQKKASKARRRMDSAEEGRRVAAAIEPARDAIEGEIRKERLAFDRFIERALHEAYQQALRQDVPTAFTGALGKLDARERKGSPNGRA